MKKREMADVRCKGKEVQAFLSVQKYCRTGLI